MRQVSNRLLWLGHAGDLRNTPQLFAAGIVAVVDLAANEPPTALPREFVYCRFPIADGGGNLLWLLRGAIDLVASLIAANVATLVCCSAGMSRSPAILWAALTKVAKSSPAAVLAEISAGAASDVSPALWGDVLAALGVIEGWRGSGAWLRRRDRDHRSRLFWGWGANSPGRGGGLRGLGDCGGGSRVPPVSAVVTGVVALKVGRYNREFAILTSWHASAAAAPSEPI